MVNKYFKILLERLYLLLAPIREDCLTCSMRTSSLDRRYGICHKCSAAIPWIVSPRCLICGRGIGCPDCSRTSNGKRYFIANRSAVFYNGDMREWLAQYKYRGQERYAPLLVRMLDRAFGAND
ncbi:hypothetical protein AM231_27060 [Paenibacillus solani]|uniref:Amidophosphoribosyltransferase n=1 Tax=Paenibacillus solani TaxID=1705565 RepID=A0A0M1N297_9BACL|nr:hypothetical protein AM231_27060 [Paenibacillus solani]